MRSDVARDLSESAAAFRDLVWPHLLKVIGSGKLKHVESVAPEDFEKDLDTLAGIDAWQISYKRGGIRGIASRVQPVNKNWQTFTIRFRRTSGAETEYSKKSRALRNREWGAIVPHLDVQAYTTQGDAKRLLGIGVTRTADLFDYIDQHLSEAECHFNASEQGRASLPRPDVYLQTNSGDGNIFIVCAWQKMRQAGIEVGIWDPTYPGDGWLRKQDEQ